MCGLVGAAGNLDIKDENCAKQLLAIDAIRGSDSTGIAVINFKNDINLVKQVGDPYTLMEYPKFKQAFVGLTKCIIGHNRYATTGKVNRNNSHPFEFNTLIGAHNGTLTNKWELNNHQRFDTDSEALYHNIEEQGLKPTIEMVNGAYALVWYDKEEDSINFLRNKERSLFIVFSKDKKKLFWASEEWMLYGILGRNGIEIEKPISVVEDYHYCYKLPFREDIFDKGRLQKIEQKQKGGGINFFQAAGGGRWIDRKKNNVTPITGTRKSLAELPNLDKDILNFTVCSNGMNEHGAKFVQLSCSKYPNHFFRVFTKTDAESEKIIKHNNWEAAIKGAEYSKVIGAFYKLDYNSFRMKGASNISTFLQKKKGFKGEEISASMFYESYKDCCWCSSPVYFSEEFRIVSEKDCLCAECADDVEVKQYLPNLFRG